MSDTTSMHRTLLKEVYKLVGPSDAFNEGTSDAPSASGVFIDETLPLQCEYWMR